MNERQQTDSYLAGVNDWIWVSRTPAVLSRARQCHDSGLSPTARIAQNRLMASDRRTVGFIIDQASSAGDVRAKPMFGEYGIYCDDRMVAMVCDDQLFVKPTPAGRAFALNAGEAPPYPGAKPCLVIDAERWDDREWLAELFRVSAAALPLPRPRAKRPASVRGKW